MTDLTVRVLPTEAPTIEVRLTEEPHGFVSVDLTPDEAADVAEQIHQAVYLTGWSCAHPTCHNHAVDHSGYCWEEH